MQEMYCITPFYRTAVKNRGHYLADYQIAWHSGRG